MQIHSSALLLIPAGLLFVYNLDSSVDKPAKHTLNQQTGSKRGECPRFSSAATWNTDEKDKLRAMWEDRGVQLRLSSWTVFWGKLSPHKDWYSSQDDFLKHLDRRLPDGARCLQLAAGLNNLAAMIRDTGKIHSILSIDIVHGIVETMRQRLRHRSATGQESKSLADFQLADAFNLNFLDFEDSGWQRFDVVIEKAGLFDVHKTCSGCLQRLLACIVTEAFEPSKGGTIITLVHDKALPEEEKSCIDKRSYGIARAVALRPDFNCTVTEIVPLRQFWFWRQDDLTVVVVKCGGVTARQAKAGCDLVFMQ